MRFAFAVFISLLLSSFELFAQTSYCPKKIAVIQGDPLSDQGAEILTKVYKALGCAIDLSKLPGARGILHFNRKMVDGELYRLRLVENAYERDFVRSLVPLFKLTNAVWENPNGTAATDKPLGYVKGIKWHETFVKEYVLETPKLVQFNTEKNLYDAYVRGAIGSFLSEKQTVNLLIDDDKLSLIPRLKKAIETKPLYHFLDSKYVEFMADFSKYIQNNQPFKVME